MRVSSWYSYLALPTSFSQSRSFEEKVDKWVSEFPGHDREAVRDYLLNWRPNTLEQTQELNFSSWKLSSLPDVFDHPMFNCVGIFKAQGVGLTELPPSCTRLAHLTFLELQNNHLEELPSNFGELINLKVLNLEDNRLTSVEPIIGCRYLVFLSLYNNRLSVLPLGLANLSLLQILNVTCNKLTAWPEQLCNFKQLQVLLLSHNRISEIPQEIKGLVNLKELDMARNQLTTIPVTLNQLRNIKLLDFSYNPINDFPIELLDLSYNHINDLPVEAIAPLSYYCTIRYQGTPWFCEVLRRIASERVNNAAGGEGLVRLRGILLERVANGGVEDVVDQTQPSLEECLDLVYGYANKQKPVQLLANSSDEQKNSLKKWLNRLSDTPLGQKKDVVFYGLITKYLELAGKNTDFAEAFWNILEDASTTCGDRMVLSILHLGIQEKLATCALEKHQAIASILIKGVWGIRLLEREAANKILQMRQEILDCSYYTEVEKRKEIEKIDEIEVYLGYPIQLRKNLGLDIDVRNMLFFNVSDLGERDLKWAQDRVLESFNNQDAVLDFLIEQDKWKEVLRFKYPQEMEDLAEQESFDDLVHGLKALTKKLLETSEPEAVFQRKTLRVSVRELSELGITPKDLDKTDEDYAVARRRSRLVFYKS